MEKSANDIFIAVLLHFHDLKYQYLKYPPPPLRRISWLQGLCGIGLKRKKQYLEKYKNICFHQN